jgi:hypothetical protein
MFWYLRITSESSEIKTWVSRHNEVDGAPDNRITADMQVLTPRDNDLDPDIWTGGHDATNIVYVYMSVNGWSRMQHCEKSISRAIIADGLMTRSSGGGRIRL